MKIASREKQHLKMKQLAQIQPALDRIKNEALIGLEYIVELISKSTKPTFQCVLCNNRANNNPRTILHHIISCNHRLKYLEKHFPTIVREITLFRSNNDAQSEMPCILQTICKAIEGTHGRLTPSVYKYTSYLKRRDVCLQEIVANRHFDETFGVTYMDVINRKTILDAISSGIAIGCKKSDTSATTVRALKKLYNRGYPYVSVENALPVQTNSTRTSASENVDHKRKSNCKRISKSCDKSDKNSDDESGDENEKKHKLPLSSEYDQESSGVSLPKSLRQDKRDADAIELGSVSTSSSLSSIRLDRSRASIRDTKKSQISSTSKELAVTNEARDRYKWEEYRFLVESATTELNKARKEHEQNPENHPLYYKELNKFRNQRYKELQAAKINPTTHDLRSEWTIYWTRYLKEMHNENVEKKKAEFRKRLNLPDEGVQTDEFKESRKEQYALAYQHTSQIDSTEHLRKSRTPSRPCRRSPRSRSVGRNEFEHLSHGSIATSLSRNYHDSEDYDCYEQEERGTSPGPEKRDVQEAEYEPLTKLSVLRPRSRSRTRNRDSGDYDYYGQDERRTEKLYAEKVEDEPLTTLSVLRLLTALEDLLGSLGPKAIGLLTKALALEKVKANSADDLLLIEDNCLILETIKEKLKGQLIAGLIEPKKINIVRTAVNNVESIIYMVFEKPKHCVFEKGTKTTVQESSSADTTLVTSSTVDLIDKAVVAQKKADALIKPCETVEQLEEFIGVQQKSKESSEPVTTTSLLQESQSLPMTDNIYDFPSSPKTSTRKNSYLEDELQHTRLTDSNLQILSKNFKNLSTEEQQHLITYLKKMKASEPARIAKLRKSVNADTNRLLTNLMGSTKAKDMHSSSIRVDNMPAHTETQKKSVRIGQQPSTYQDETSNTVYASSTTSTLPEANKFNYNYTPYFIQGYGMEEQNNQPYPVQYPNVSNPHSVQTETQNQSIPMYQLPSSNYDQTLKSMQSSSSISNVYDANNGNYNYMPYFLQGYGLMQQIENNECPVQYPNVTNAHQTQNETQTQSIPMDQLLRMNYDQTSNSVQASPTLTDTNNDNFNYMAYFLQGYDLMWQKKDNYPCPIQYPNVADQLPTHTETETQFTSMYQLPKTDCNETSSGISVQSTMSNLCDTKDIMVIQSNPIQQNAPPYPNQCPNPLPTHIKTKSVPFYQLPSTYNHKPSESMQSSSTAKCDLADPRVGKGIYKNIQHPQQENHSTEQNNQPHLVQYPRVKYPNQMERFCNPMIQQIETGNQQSNPMIQCTETGNQPSNSMIQRVETGNQSINPMIQQSETGNQTKNPQQIETGNQRSSSEIGSKKTRWSPA